MSKENSSAQASSDAFPVMFGTRGDGSLSFQLGDGSRGRVDLGERLHLPELDKGGNKALRYGRIVVLDGATSELAAHEAVVKSVGGRSAGSAADLAGAARCAPLAARELSIFADLAKSPHLNLMSPIVTGVDRVGTVHMVLPCGSLCEAAPSMPATTLTWPFLPVWTDAAPPFRFSRGATPPIRTDVAAAAGHGEMWRPEGAMALPAPRRR